MASIVHLKIKYHNSFGEIIVIQDGLREAYLIHETILKEPYATALALGKKVNKTPTIVIDAIDIDVRKDETMLGMLGADPKWYTRSYCTKLGFLSLDEVKMKEEIWSWFHRLGYEEGFGPEKVTHIKVRRRWIVTYAIVSAVSLEKRKYIFCEDEVLLVFFNMHDCNL